MKILLILVVFICTNLAWSQVTSSDCKKKGLKFDRKNRKCKENSFTPKKKKCDKLKLKWDESKGLCEFSLEELKKNNLSQYNLWFEKCKKKGFEVDENQFITKGTMKCDKTKTVTGASNKKVKRANKKKIKKDCAIKGYKIKSGDDDTFVCDKTKMTLKRSKCESRNGAWDENQGKCSVASKVDLVKQKIQDAKTKVVSKFNDIKTSTDEKANNCYKDGLQFNRNLRRCSKKNHDDYSIGGSQGYLSTKNKFIQTVKSTIPFFSGELATVTFSTYFDSNKCRELMMEFIPEGGQPASNLDDLQVIRNRKYSLIFKVNYASGASPAPLRNDNIKFADIKNFGEDDYAQTITEEVFRELKLENCF